MLKKRFTGLLIDNVRLKAEFEQRNKNLNMSDAMSRINEDDLQKLVSNNNSTNKTIVNFLDEWSKIGIF